MNSYFAVPLQAASIHPSISQRPLPQRSPVPSMSSPSFPYLPATRSDPSMQTSQRCDSNSTSMYSPGLLLAPLTIAEQHSPENAINVLDDSRAIGHTTSQSNGASLSSRRESERDTGRQIYRERGQKVGSPTKPFVLRRPWAEDKLEASVNRHQINKSILGLEEYPPAPSSKRRLESSRSASPVYGLHYRTRKDEETCGSRWLPHGEVEDTGRKDCSSIAGIEPSHSLKPTRPTFGPYEAALSSRRQIYTSTNSPYSAVTHNRVTNQRSTTTSPYVYHSSDDGPWMTYNPDGPFSAYADEVSRERYILERRLSRHDDELRKYNMARSKESLEMDLNDVQAAEMLAGLDHSRLSKKMRTSSPEEEGTKQPASRPKITGRDSGRVPTTTTKGIKGPKRAQASPKTRSPLPPDPRLPPYNHEEAVRDLSNDVFMAELLAQEKRVKDDRPRRPMNSWMIYTKYRRRKLRESNCELKTGEASTRLADEWRFVLQPHEQALWEGLYLRLRAAFDAKHPDYIFTRSGNGTKKKGTRGGKKEEKAVASSSGSASPVSSRAPSPTTKNLGRYASYQAKEEEQEEEEEEVDELEEGFSPQSPIPAITPAMLLPAGNNRLRAVAPTIDIPHPRIPCDWPAFMTPIPSLDEFSPRSVPHTSIETPAHGRHVVASAGRCAECKNRDEKHNLICVSTGTCQCGPKPHKECSMAIRITTPEYIISRERDYFHHI